MGSYFGPKATSGLCQPTIALMPPHHTDIETHLGGGAILQRKAPALRNIGIERNERALARFQCNYPVEKVHGCAHRILAEFPFTGRELVYSDPLPARDPHLRAAPSLPAHRAGPSRAHLPHPVQRLPVGEEPQAFAEEHACPGRRAALAKQFTELEYKSLSRRCRTILTEARPAAPIPAPAQEGKPMPGGQIRRP